MVWYGMVWYDMVWSGMVWYGMVWCGMVWCGMVCFTCITIKTAYNVPVHKTVFLKMNPWFQNMQKTKKIKTQNINLEEVHVYCIKRGVYKSFTG
jgi:hypothetical protein